MGLRHATNTGNTFCGLMKEFPGLGVDRFNTTAKVFLLTHCHSDHLYGLKNKSFDSKVYCSEATKETLSLDSSFAHVLPYIKTIEIDCPFIFTLDGKEITITLILAYHCPGATMYLIEGEKKNVLYTGDIRAEAWWVETLPKNPYLFPYTIGLKAFDNIYLDTTFSYRGEPFIEIPQNNEGLSVATLLINSYPKDDPDVQFYFVDSTSGFEEAWAQIVSSLNGSLHMNNKNRLKIELLNSNKLYPQYGPLLNHLITKRSSDSDSMIFHACGKRLGSCKLNIPKFPIMIKQCIEFNILDFTGVFCPILLSSLSKSERAKGLKTIGHTVKGNIIYEFRGRRWICLKEGNELLPAEIKLVFSRHSSYSECRNFISKFKFRDVYPCTDSKNTWMNGMTMSRLFGDLIHGISDDDTRIFAYDKAKFQEYGSPSSSILNRPIRTINRWNFSQCTDEIKSVKEYLSNNSIRSSRQHSLKREPSPKSEFNSEGQKFISKFNMSDYSEYEKQFHQVRNKDMQLQKVIIGRDDAWYKRLIENQQKLYFNFYHDIEGGVRNTLGNDYDDEIKFNDGMKLGGVYKYNYDDGNILDELTDHMLHYDSQNSLRGTAHSSPEKPGMNITNRKKQLSFSPQAAQSDEITDIEDNEPDDIISEDQHIQCEKEKLKLHSSCKMISKDISASIVGTNQENLHHPCLKRRKKNKNISSKKSDRTFIESTFSSFEISFNRLITDDKNMSIIKEPQMVSLMMLTSRQISSSKIFFKSCVDIDSSKIRSISNELNEDPANWFGLKLKSVNTLLDRV